MVLTPEQHSQIATAYEKASADEMVPRQQREAFARKANWFRMLARIAAKKEVAVAKKEATLATRLKAALTAHSNDRFGARQCLGFP
jgi:hypothetical protein